MRYYLLLLLAAVMLCACSDGEQANQSSSGRKDDPNTQITASTDDADFGIDDLGIIDGETGEVAEGGFGTSGFGSGGGGSEGAGAPPISDDLGNLGLGSGGNGNAGLGYGGGAGAGKPPEPGSAAYRQREMRRLLRDLKTYPIAYETPKMATQDMTFDVTLAIDGSGDDSAVEGLPQKQNITENVAQLSEVVEARLSGAAFEIKSSNATTQFLRPSRETVWRWSVAPLQSGNHELYLEIFAKVDGDNAIMLESFSDLITVDVAPSANKPRLIDDMRIYISIIGGLVSLLLGLIALMGHLKNRRIKVDEE